MSVLFGTIINGICIIVGSGLGLFFTNIPERYKNSIMQVISLVVILIGLQMAFEVDNVVFVLLSLLSGVILGEWIRLEDRLNDFGHKLEERFQKGEGRVGFAQGFITASLIFSVGAMAIVGALDSGLRNDHELLITKGIMDGFAAMVFTTTLGSGVLFSVIPVVLYQAVIALSATRITKYVPEWFLNDLIGLLTAVGGLMIVAIGLNLLNLVKIRIGNLLPALFTSGIILFIYEKFFN